MEMLADSELFGFFCSHTDCMGGRTALGYRKAIACMQAFAVEYPDQHGICSAPFLQNWLLWMFWQGYSFKTAVHYLDIISALYTSVSLARESCLDAAPAFRQVKAKVLKLGPDVWQRTVSDDEFAAFANFARASGRSADSELALFGDIMLFSLINRGMNVSDVVRLKCDDLETYCDESREMARKYTSPHRRYVFPLRQSEMTPRQLETYVRETLCRVLLSRNIRVLGTLEHTLKTYWAYAALRSGACGSEVLRGIGTVPAGLPALALCAENEADGFSVSALASAVTRFFLYNPSGWYALRLKNGVDYNNLTARLSALGPKMPCPELFYPMVEHENRNGKTRKVPILPGIVFFKSRMSDIQPLFAEIGDIAWCYKTGNAYSQISLKEMACFQQAVGQFTPDTGLFPAGSTVPRKNDRVVILGGMFAGHRANFDSAYDEDSGKGGGRTIYRLMLTADNGVEWIVDLDSRLVAEG